MDECILDKISLFINKEQLLWLVYKFACAKTLTYKDPEMTENTVLVRVMCNYDKSEVLAF